MKKEHFVEVLLSWYDSHGRDLPWRKTKDPYKVLLSEVMLQQTQVPRVIIKWQEWLDKFPTVESVAKAQVRDVLLAWQGMGYNNRALRLKECCERVAEDGWPQDPEGLDALPGIGKYTAHAIACFAFGQRVPLVDVNVRLVYAPFTGQDADDDTIWEFAQKILPTKRFYDYNQALFDLGTVIKSGDLSLLPKDLQELYQGVELNSKKPKEKLYAGFPMRLYRGALVQCLRESEDHTASFDRCAAHVKDKLAKQPVKFIKEISARLEKDGIVVVEKDRVRLR